MRLPLHIWQLQQSYLLHSGWLCASAGLLLVLALQAALPASEWLSACPRRSAPELLLGEHCTTKADVFSMGILLWEICCNEVPVRGQLREPQ